jgi:hypothetical protein|tara:strand:+ start:2283 stop:2984 length:702 start_codon:yes stop_codon:yes gene_type:complete
MNKMVYSLTLAATLIAIPLSCTKKEDKIHNQETSPLDNIVSCVNGTNVDRVYCDLPKPYDSKTPNNSINQLEQDIKDKLAQGEMEKWTYRDFVIDRVDANNIIICSQALNYININNVIKSIEERLWVTELIGIENNYVAIGNYELNPETEKDIKQYEDFQQAVFNSLKNDFLKQDMTEEKIDELIQEESYDLLPENTPEQRKEYLIEKTKGIFQRFYPLIEDPIDVDYLLNSV